MFGLLKLVAYGLLGYALYEFVRGALGTEIAQAVNAAQGGGSQGNQGGAPAPRPIQQAAGRANLTGPGQGSVQKTVERDGGSVRHTVGRGVVS